MKKRSLSLKKWLYILSGEDWVIIEQSSDKVKRSFFRIGILVAFIFFGSWISATSFVAHILENEKWISVPVGIIWALIVINLYILLLYTISPKLLPKALKKSKDGKLIIVNDMYNNNQNEISFSLIYRFFFIGILAIIIAQPLNVLLFSKYIERSLENYKIEYRFKSTVSADSACIKNELKNKSSFTNQFIFVNDSVICKQLTDKVIYDSIFLVSTKRNLDSLKKWDESSVNKEIKIDSFRNVLNALVNNEIASDQNFLAILGNINTNDFKLESYIQEISEQIRDKNESYQNLVSTLDKSDFYVKKIQILISENPLAWVLMLFVILLFWLPIYLKYRIRKKTEFYSIKKKIEQSKIDSEYKIFNNQFEELFKLKYELYNKNTLHKLIPILNVLEKLNPSVHNEIVKDIHKETSISSVKKYEHWSDPPYRTKSKFKLSSLNKEEHFINKLYQ